MVRPASAQPIFINIGANQGKPAYSPQSKEKMRSQCRLKPSTTRLAVTANDFSRAEIIVVFHIINLSRLAFYISFGGQRELLRAGKRTKVIQSISKRQPRRGGIRVEAHPADGIDFVMRHVAL